MSDSAAYKRAYYQANRERLLAAARARYEAKKQDPEWRAAINAANRAREAANPEKTRACKAAYKEKVKNDPVLKARRLEIERKSARKRYRQRVGIEGASAETRSGVCPICFADGPLVCDHEHRPTGGGPVRGWICSGCNMSIGRLGDTVEALERALAYLVAHRDRPLDPPPG